MAAVSSSELKKLADAKTDLLDLFFDAEPRLVEVKETGWGKKGMLPRQTGEDVNRMWDELYGLDPKMKSIVVETVAGPSTPSKDWLDGGNPAFPYEQIRALVGDGGKWRWPEIWKNLDLLPRRGLAWRHIDDPANLGKIENPNPNITPLKCLVVGGGPVGFRLAIELALGGHRVVQVEKRREVRDPETGVYTTLGFTNRVNRPHINNFCRNDLDRLNGRKWMSSKMAFPVFTNLQTSSIGIDECQILLMKSALLLGVEFRLGVAYEGAEVVVPDERTQRPKWAVNLKADEGAQTRFNMTEDGTEQFDALFGVDGGQSTVRDSMVDYLGEPQTRKFKNMYGIVANLRKLEKKQLMEKGFHGGLEPDDINFPTEGVFFYKASYHNYFICHPSTEEMEANGIPWKGCFTFHGARSKPNPEKDALKGTLKKYIQKRIKELNLPYDETLPNDGFVDAPNDCMSFDFSTFYNSPKSAYMNVPPMTWDSGKDGEWECGTPLVALCGDAVADPFWLAGVGLQRGWTSGMDAAFYADNLYNNISFIGKPAQDPNDPIETPVDWTQHMDHLNDLAVKLSDASRNGALSAELGSGLLDDKGPIVQQIRKKLRESGGFDAPVPQFQIETAPWTRYSQFERDMASMYRGVNVTERAHPSAEREIAIFLKNEAFVAQAEQFKNKRRPGKAQLTWAKRFEYSAFWGMMEMLEINGQPVPGQGGQTPSVADEAADPASAPPPRPKPCLNEVQEKASRKSDSIRDSALASAGLGAAPPPGAAKKFGPRDNIANLFAQMQQKQCTSSDAHPSIVAHHANLMGSGADDDDRARAALEKSLITGNVAHLETAVSHMRVAGGDEPGDHMDAVDRAKLVQVRNELVITREKLAIAEREAELLRKTLKAYESAEVQLLAKVSG